jgi:hypothetical protein
MAKLCYSSKDTTDIVDENPSRSKSRLNILTTSIVVFTLALSSLLSFKEHFTEHEADGSRVVVWAHKQVCKQDQVKSLKGLIRVRHT